MSHYITQEIVEEIILKLSSKPLIRFKSVNKTWYNLISNPRFLAKHLLPDNNNLLLVKRRHNTSSNDNVLSLLFDHMVQTRLVLVPYPNVSILGPCNGLMCLFDMEHRYIALWSPVAGEVRTLPASDVPDEPGYRALNPVLGFGYDVGTDDYKVVRYSGIYELDRYYKVRGYHKVEIYSFNSGRWRGESMAEISTCVLPFLPKPYSAYSNGFFMWSAVNSNELSCLLWFRMSDESFGETLLSIDTQVDRYGRPKGEIDTSWAMMFFVMNYGTVALVLYHLWPEVERCFNVWVLLEFGIEDSWTRWFTVGPLTGIERPLWFWKNGLMIMESKEGELVLYDPFVGEITSLNICGVDMTSQIISIEEKYIL